MGYCVLDSSALLAWLQDEPGQDCVDRCISESLMSAVNWSEVLQKSAQRGIETNRLPATIKALGMLIVSFDERQAQLTAGLWLLVKPAGLSLADRCCLALAKQRQLPVLTADRTWDAFENALGVDVQLIR